MSKLQEIGGVRLREFEVLLEVSRAKSIREAARRLGTTPGQVSRSVRQLEARVGRRLFKRSASGVLLTSLGASFLQASQELVEGGRKLEEMLSGSPDSRRTIAIAGTSFLSLYFTAPLVCRLSPRLGETSFRFLDLPPDQLVAIGLRGAFEVAVHFGKTAWPGTWVSEKVGRSDWILCARSGHPLPARASLAKVLQYPFVVPTYWTSEGLIQGDDQFPLSFSRRRAGFETATADGAVPILLHTDHVAFLPAILTRSFIARGELKQLMPPDLRRVDREIWVSARSDAVPASFFRELVQGMRAGLSD